MPATLDPVVLAAAAARLSPTELVWLVRIVTSPDGAATLAGLDASIEARLAPWLRRADDGDALLGVKQPDPELTSSRQRARRCFGVDLFDLPSAAHIAPALPSVVAGGRLPTVKQAAINQAVWLFKRVAKSEDASRKIIGSLFNVFRDGVVFEAIAAAVARCDEFAEPRGWIEAYAKRNYGDAAKRPKRLSAAEAHVRTEPPVIRATRPIASPENLGLSPERAREIQDRNRLLKSPSRT